MTPIADSNRAPRMGNAAKVFLTLTIIFAAVVVASTLAIGAVTYRAGIARISVHDKSADGVRISLGVPMILLEATLPLMPRPDMGPASEEAARWWPVLEAACVGLEDAPEGVYVEVDDDDDHVRIAKEGSSFVIDVDSDDATIHVSVPVRSFQAVLRHFEPRRGRAIV